MTGSGKQRVGWYVADALAKRGYAVAVHYVSSAAEAEATVTHLKTYGVDSARFRADLTDEGQVKSMIQEVVDRFRRIDVLVNSAAVWKSKKLEDVTAADVRLHFETNTLGTFLCAQQAGLVMAQQGEGGCIVNIGDWAEVRPYLDYAAYFPSKGAIPALTRSLTMELGTRNPKVRVNSISPGPVLLPPDMPDDVRQRVINATLVKREGKPENIAQAVLFFVDNDFTTGTCLPVDGGRTVYAPD